MCGIVVLGRNKEKRGGTGEEEEEEERREESGQRRDRRTGISGRCKRDGKGSGLQDKEEKRW